MGSKDDGAVVFEESGNWAWEIVNPVYVKELRVTFPQSLREALDLGKVKVLVGSKRTYPINEGTLAQPLDRG